MGVIKHFSSSSNDCDNKYYDGNNFQEFIPSPKFQLDLQM